MMNSHSKNPRKEGVKRRRNYQRNNLRKLPSARGRQESSDLKTVPVVTTLPLSAQSSPHSFLPDPGPGCGKRLSLPAAVRPSFVGGWRGGTQGRTFQLDVFLPADSWLLTGQQHAAASGGSRQRVWDPLQVLPSQSGRYPERCSSSKPLCVAQWGPIGSCGCWWGLPNKFHHPLGSQYPTPLLWHSGSQSHALSKGIWLSAPGMNEGHLLPNLILSQPQR